MSDFVYAVGAVVTGLGGIALVVLFACAVLDWVADRFAKTTGIYDAVVRTIWQQVKDKRKRKESPNDQP